MKSSFKSKSMQFFLLSFVVLLFNVVIYSPSLRFDVTNEMPWRQTDSQAEITAYAKNTTRFYLPTVNASLKEWGPGVIEIVFPIYQFVTGKMVPLLTPLIKNNLHSDVKGPIKLPYGMHFKKYTESKILKGDKVIYTLKFTLAPSWEYKLATLFHNNISQYLHLYLVSNKTSMDKKCISLEVNGNASADTPREYCYSNNVIPVTYIPILPGENTFKFIFSKSMAPGNLESAISLFPTSKYASPMLFVGRLLNMFAVVAISLIIAVTFFPSLKYRYACAIAISAIPAFGFFETFIHEEIQAFLFVSIFLWVVFKKNLSLRWLVFASVSLSIAVAIRPYYILYSLMLIAFMFRQDGFNMLKKASYYLAGILIITPAILWYSWTQHLVRNGADTIGIFSGRVFLSSLLDSAKWHAFLGFFTKFHFGLPVFFLFIITIVVYLCLRFSKKITSNFNFDVFLGVGFIISLISLPLIFDSASIHNYYSFPITSYFSIASIICFYEIYKNIDKKPYLNKKNELLRFSFKNILFLSFFSVIIVSGVAHTYVRFYKNERTVYDPLDYVLLGGVPGEIFSSSDKIVLLGSGGPQDYGMTNRNGRRDAGFYSGYHFQSVSEIKEVLKNERKYSVDTLTTFNNDIQQFKIKDEDMKSLTYYLNTYYGPISSYAGIGSCKAALHRTKTWDLYTKFIYELAKNTKGSVVYKYLVSTPCLFIKFPK